MKDLMMNIEDIFGRKCVGITAEAELRAKSITHHSILLILKGGDIENVHKTDSIVSAELPTKPRDSEPQTLIK